MGYLRAFVVTLSVLDALVVVVGTYLLPPDPLAQLVLVGPFLLSALAVAWWLVCRDGFEQVQALVESNGRGRQRRPPAATRLRIQAEPTGCTTL